MTVHGGGGGPFPSKRQSLKSRRLWCLSSCEAQGGKGKGPGKPVSSRVYTSDPVCRTY